MFFSITWLTPSILREASINPDLICAEGISIEIIDLLSFFPIIFNGRVRETFSNSAPLILEGP